MTLTFAQLSTDTFDAFASMHGASECQGCFCTYWQFKGDNRAWQLRTPDENRADKLARVSAGQTHGLIATESATREVVGTIQFEPRDALVKLTARMPYRGLGAGSGVWAIGCVRVREAHRRAGTARALVRATVEHLRERRAAAVEAFPRRGDDLRDDEQWTGPEALYASLGFACVREHPQYPVYRLALD